ncbi:MAG: diguanylate cyclase [Terriglobales bacterium]
MEKTALLYEASQAILSTLDSDEVLRQILAVVRKQFQVPYSAVLLMDDSGELSLRAHSGWPADFPVVRVASGIPIECAHTRKPVNVPDVGVDERFLRVVPDPQSQVAIPLIAHDRVLGVLDCQSDVKNFFDAETVGTLTLFSTLAAIALQNARLHELERRHATQLELINAIARQTTAVTELAELLAHTCALIRGALGVDHVTVWLLDEHRLVLSAHQGSLTLRLGEGAVLEENVGLCGRALSTGAPVVAKDVSAESDYIAGLAEARSELCLPLVSFGQSLGVLTLSSAHLRAFTQADLAPLEPVADICAVAIQNAMYLDRVRQLAYRDGLTGIFNRRFFEMRVLEELERARRHRLELSVIMIDVDGFKLLNDELGHLLGDEALRQITTVFSQQVRKADVVCRYGGDEFAILLPETSGKNACVTAEKLRAAVAAWTFPGVPSPLTISAGIACFPEHGNSRDELIEAADKALYGAKTSGRDRAVFEPSKVKVISSGAHREQA